MLVVGFGAFKLMKGQLHVRTSQHPNCQGVTCEGSADIRSRKNSDAKQASVRVRI